MAAYLRLLQAQRLVWHCLQPPIAAVAVLAALEYSDPSWAQAFGPLLLQLLVVVLLLTAAT